MQVFAELDVEPETKPITKDFEEEKTTDEKPDQEIYDDKKQIDTEPKMDCK